LNPFSLYERRECKKTSKKETKLCTQVSFRMQMHFTAQCCRLRFLSCPFRVCRSFRDSCWSRCWRGQVGLRIKFAGRRLVVAMAAAVRGITFAVIVTFIMASEHGQLHVKCLFRRQICTFHHEDRRGSLCDRSGPRSHEDSREHHERGEYFETEQVCCRRGRMAHSQEWDRK
jgi:hypothetical protein